MDHMLVFLQIQKWPHCNHIIHNSSICLVTPYPFTVDDRNTRYGPMRSLTKGSGMAAASSITTNSAWPSLWASDGWMYWKGEFIVKFSGRPLQLVYCSDCAWESSPEMNCCQLQWLLCLGSPSRNPHPSQIQVIIKWPVQPSVLLHKKHRQKTVYDARVCVQQLRLDHKISVCRPSPSCLPFIALILSSFSLHLVGPYNFFWPCSCHCVQTLLHTFLSNAFNKSMPRALQVLCKSICNIFTLLLGVCQYR